MYLALLIFHEPILADAKRVWEVDNSAADSLKSKLAQKRKEHMEALSKKMPKLPLEKADDDAPKVRTARITLVKKEPEPQQPTASTASSPTQQITLRYTKAGKFEFKSVENITKKPADPRLAAAPHAKYAAKRAAEKKRPVAKMKGSVAAAAVPKETTETEGR